MENPSLTLRKENTQYNTDKLINHLMSKTTLQNKTDKTPQSNSHLSELQNFTLIKLSESYHLLGQGCFTEILLAKNNYDHDFYAIKRVSKSQLLASGGNFGKVFTEIAIHQRLSHKHIIRLHSHFDDPNHIYMVMHYARGGDLFQMIKLKHRLPEELCYKYFLQVVTAVEYLHKCGLVHRDIKPENLLLDEHDNILLCDFGLCVESSEKRVTFCGTFEYMAPEILLQMPYNQGVDIWSLGVLLYEMSHGFSPYVIDSANSLSSVSFRKESGLKDKNDDCSSYSCAGQVNYEEVFKNILKNNLLLDSNLSSELCDLIRRLLVTDNERRISLREVYDHPWVVKHERINLDKRKQMIEEAKKRNKLLFNSNTDFKRKNTELDLEINDGDYNTFREKPHNKKSLKLGLGSTFKAGGLGNGSSGSETECDPFDIVLDPDYHTGKNRTRMLIDDFTRKTVKRKANDKKKYSLKLEKTCSEQFDKEFDDREKALTTYLETEEDKGSITNSNTPLNSNKRDTNSSAERKEDIIIPRQSVLKRPVAAKDNVDQENTARLTSKCNTEVKPRVSMILDRNRVKSLMSESEMFSSKKDSKKSDDKNKLTMQNETTLSIISSYRKCNKEKYNDSSIAIVKSVEFQAFTKKRTINSSSTGIDIIHTECSSSTRMNPTYTSKARSNIDNFLKSIDSRADMIISSNSKTVTLENDYNDKRSVNYPSNSDYIHVEDCAKNSKSKRLDELDELDYDDNDDNENVDGNTNVDNSMCYYDDNFQQNRNNYNNIASERSLNLIDRIGYASNLELRKNLLNELKEVRKNSNPMSEINSSNARHKSNKYGNYGSYSNKTDLVSRSSKDCSSSSNKDFRELESLGKDTIVLNRIRNNSNSNRNVISSNNLPVYGNEDENVDTILPLEDRVLRNYIKTNSIISSIRSFSRKQKVEDDENGFMSKLLKFFASFKCGSSS